MRRRRMIGVLGYFATVFLIWPSLAGADGDATELMRKVSGAFRSVGTEREELDVLVVSAPQEEVYTVEQARSLSENSGSGVVRKRATRSIRYSPDGADKIHVVFSLPREDAGTGFLVWRSAHDDGDKQWLFLPALKRIRRVPISSTQTFVGTNLIYEDVRELAGERVDRYHYSAAGSGQVDGRKCEIVVAKAAVGATSAYASRKLWIDEERSFPLKIEYYDERGKVWKVLRNASLQEVKPGVYRPSLTEMRDLRINEATLLSFPTRKVGETIPHDVFTKDYLQNP